MSEKINSIYLVSWILHPLTISWSLFVFYFNRDIHSSVYMVYEVCSYFTDDRLTGSQIEWVTCYPHDWLYTDWFTDWASDLFLLFISSLIAKLCLIVLLPGRLQITGSGSGRRALWLDATIHAREWLATATHLKITSHVRRDPHLNWPDLATSRAPFYFQYVLDRPTLLSFPKTYFVIVCIYLYFCWYATMLSDTSILSGPAMCTLYSIGCSSQDCLIKRLPDLSYAISFLCPLFVVLIDKASAQWDNNLSD